MTSSKRFARFRPTARRWQRPSLPVSHSDGNANSAPRGGTRPTGPEVPACRPRAPTRRLGRGAGSVPGGLRAGARNRGGELDPRSGHRRARHHAGTTHPAGRLRGANAAGRQGGSAAGGAGPGAEKRLRGAVCVRGAGQLRGKPRLHAAGPATARRPVPTGPRRGRGRLQPHAFGAGAGTDAGGHGPAAAGGLRADRQLQPVAAGQTGGSGGRRAGGLPAGNAGARPGPRRLCHEPPRVSGRQSRVRRQPRRPGGLGCAGAAGQGHQRGGPRDSVRLCLPWHVRAQRRRLVCGLRRVHGLRPPAPRSAPARRGGDVS